MQKRGITVCKQHKLNTADFDDFTLNDIQIYLNLIAKIIKVDEQGRYLKPEELQREYILTAKEFSDNFNVDLKSSYRAIKQVVDKLLKTDIKIDNKYEYTRINVCSQATYNSNSGRITILFTDSIMPYLAQVTEKFTMYNLKEVSEFKSIYSIRLYELIQSFKDTGYLKITIDELRHSFGVGKKFKLYGHLKSKTFTHAIKEINKNYHIDLDFEEIKEGRKVTAIKFTFNKTKITRRYKQDGTYTNEYIKPKVKSKYPDIVLDGQMSFEDKQQNQGKIGNTVNNILQNLQEN